MAEPLHPSRWIALGAVIFPAFLVSGCAGPPVSASGPTATYTAQEQQGERLFTIHCSSCHSTIPDSMVVGPSMAGVADRAANRIDGIGAREYLEMSIEDPAAYVVDGFADLMPADISDSLSEEEMNAIVAYLMSLEE